jgi:hypothetical protein
LTERAQVNERAVWILPAAVLVATAAIAAPAARGEFQIEEVGSVVAFGGTELKRSTIAFADHRNDELADSATGLIRFEDWTRARPVQRQFLSLYPGYVEPTVNVTANGVTKSVNEKLHMYVAEARFMLARPPSSIDLARYATLPFLERMDPSIKHRLISAADAVPLNDPEAAFNRNPERRWCDARPNTICIESRYHLEGKLPLGIRLINKLTESEKKVADYLEFQSEMRVLPEIDQAGSAKLTGINAPVTGALEQSIFYVNQVMRFGKFLALLQPHPADPDKTIATTFIVLAIKSKVLEQKKEYESVPVLRNLVPAQVLMGKSSFNTGTSISAGLPSYARNRVKIIAAILDQE